MTAGRGKGKIAPGQPADEFWRDFTRDRYEMLIGNTKLLSLVNRLAPSIAERILIIPPNRYLLRLRGRKG